MKTWYISFLIIVIGVCGACSLEQEQELIIVSKNKKKYVSKEQCAECEIDSTVLINELNMTINSLRQTVDALQHEGFVLLSNYADGEKDCFLRQADKVELTQYHEATMKLNQELERCKQDIQKMQQRLEHVRKERLKIQSE